MVWFLMALILGSFIYTVSIVMKYQADMAEGKDLILTFENQVDKLGKMIQHEKSLGQQLSEKLEQARKTSADLKNEITLVDAQINMGKQRETSLEMDMYKKEFKRSKQRGF